jgi:putative transposase
MKAIKDIRLKEYDYSSNGFYFITVCTNHRKPFFKNTVLLKLVEDEMQILNSTKGVSLDQFVVMPDHLHMIIILDECDLRLGEIVRRFKAKVSKQVTEKIWQPNYYEHVIRDEKALNKIRNYILNNPLVAEIDFEQFY